MHETVGESMGPSPPSSGGGSRRRPRYRGTHPRRFEERYKELRAESYPGMHEHVRAQGRTPAGTHVPVLLHEVLDVLNPRPGDVVLDGTIGFGGHATELMRRIGPEGRLYGMDVDGQALAKASARLASIGTPFKLFRSNFAGVGGVMSREGLNGFDAVLIDLGVSSMQIDDPARGFSYKHDGPLDMRMDQRRSRTAADYLADLDVDDLAEVLREYSDEPDAERIAVALVTARSSGRLDGTRSLVKVVFAAKGISMRRWRAEKRPELHPAAKTFQALRILVNDERNTLREFLRAVPYCLKPGGRVAVISFHSGEDRCVKEAFAQGLAAGLYGPCADRPMRPAPTEYRANPRAASAMLRWARAGDRSP